MLLFDATLSPPARLERLSLASIFFACTSIPGSLHKPLASAPRVQQLPDHPGRLALIAAPAAVRSVPLRVPTVPLSCCVRAPAMAQAGVEAQGTVPYRCPGLLSTLAVPGVLSRSRRPCCPSQVGLVLDEVWLGTDEVFVGWLYRLLSQGFCNDSAMHTDMFQGSDVLIGSVPQPMVKSSLCLSLALPDVAGLVGITKGKEVVWDNCATYRRTADRTARGVGCFFLDPKY